MIKDSKGDNSCLLIKGEAGKSRIIEAIYNNSESCLISCYDLPIFNDSHNNKNNKCFIIKGVPKDINSDAVDYCIETINDIINNIISTTVLDINCYQYLIIYNPYWNEKIAKTIINKINDNYNIFNNIVITCT